LPCGTHKKLLPGIVSTAGTLVENPIKQKLEVSGYKLLGGKMRILLDPVLVFFFFLETKIGINFQYNFIKIWAKREFKDL